MSDIEDTQSIFLKLKQIPFYLENLNSNNRDTILNNLLNENKNLFPKEFINSLCSKIITESDHMSFGKEFNNNNSEGNIYMNISNKIDNSKEQSTNPNTIKYMDGEEEAIKSVYYLIGKIEKYEDREEIFNEFIEFLKEINKG